MSLAKLAPLASLLPLAALAQGLAAPIEAAKEAGRKQQAGIERREQLIEQAAPGEAGAQEPAEPPPEEGEKSVNLNRAAEQLEGAAPEVEPGPAAAPGAAQPPDTYTVKPGDTLWDLSGRFLNNPWYWPKVWSYNPEITNPHWIYPGNVVRFFPSAEEAPTRVEPAAPVAAAEEVPSAPRELEDVSKGSLKAEQLGDDDAVAVVGPYKVAQVPSRPAPIRRDTFMTRMQLEEAGRIVAAFEEKLMLSYLDKIYAEFREPGSVKVGQTYAIYRTEGPVSHPATGETVGYKTLILGQARVTRLDEKAVTLVITASYDAIDRGDYLGPWSEKLVKAVQVRPNQASVDGYIVSVTPSVLTNLGENNVVYLDKGQADGVEEGNTFQVLRSGDRSKEPPDRPIYDASLPLEVVGTLVVFDVKERNSTAFVARSPVEIYVGDRVQMRPARARGSGGS
ncbi:MAG TPA: LysM peptidoglycan-binding domain-containing protein [Anaeromyxobacteraceae bacterium]|nr:LysM peptidoglycan-binding domain-containing protein [Anaeromyxobacteraceae bacterium]